MPKTETTSGLTILDQMANYLRMKHNWGPKRREEERLRLLKLYVGCKNGKEN